MGPRAGRAPVGRRGRPDRLAARAAAGRRGRSRGRRRRRAADSPGARAPAGRRHGRCRGLPVQRAGVVRHRGRRVLLRSRAPRGGDGRAPGRCAAAGGGRPVGQRQVIRPARRAPARPRRRRPSRQQRLDAGIVAPGRAPDARAGGRNRRGAASRQARPRGRPVRGGLRRLLRRARARGVRRCPRGVRTRSGPPGARAGRDPGRLLRTLRELSRALAARGCQPGACRPDAPRRAAPRHRASRRARRPAGRSRPH